MSKCDFPACQMTRSNCSVSCVLSKSTVPEARYRDAGPSERSVYDRTGLPPVVVRADLDQAPAPVRVKPLQFRDETGDGVLTSRETGELFRIFPQADGTFFAPKLEDGSAPDAQTLIDRLNARHTARVLAALEPDAAPVRARDVEIARLAREIGEIGRDLGWHRVYDRADAIRAALQAPDAGVVAELVEALRYCERAPLSGWTIAQGVARATLAKLGVR